MKSLVIYYSRSGKTRDVAQRIAEGTSADVEEIVEVECHESYARSAIDAILKRKPTLRPFGRSLDDYDLIFVGTPIWTMNAVPAIQSFLATQEWMSRNVALFCTMGGMGDKKAFHTMRSLAPGARIIGELGLDSQAFKDEEALQERVTSWIEKVQSSAA